jgi:plastocyanin
VSHSSFVRAIAAFVLVVAVALAVPPATARQQPASTLEIVDFSFSPAELRVRAGTSVEVRNGGARPHTVTDRGSTFDTDPIVPGATATLSFETPGRYSVFCRINPGTMNAVVIVEADDAEATLPAARVETTDPARGEDLAFVPASLRVEAGATIDVADVGGKPHSLTSDDGSFDTGRIEPGAEDGTFAGSTASFRVDEPGIYEFFCQIHPDAMRGRLEVVASKAGDDVTDDGGGGTAPPPASASIADFEFVPLELSVAAEADVTWTNDGEAPHTVTFDDPKLDGAPIDSGRIEPGDAATLTAPSEQGSYTYLCEIHPSMRGVLTVAAASTAAPDDGTSSTTAAAQPVASDDGDDDGLPVVPVVIATIGGFAAGLVSTHVLGGRRP